MKVRQGFVSNSSSCSFICSCCGYEWEGYDWEENPRCPECGEHANDNKANGFAEYLCMMNGLDYEFHLQRYIKWKQRGGKR